MKVTIEFDDSSTSQQLLRRLFGLGDFIEGPIVVKSEPDVDVKKTVEAVQEVVKKELKKQEPQADKPKKQKPQADKPKKQGRPPKERPEEKKVELPEGLTKETIEHGEPPADANHAAINSLLVQITKEHGRDAMRKGMKIVNEVGGKKNAKDIPDDLVASVHTALTELSDELAMSGKDEDDLGY